ncbi:uncharacterized protein LAJ45_06928 [Morchella importuna]|uniref:uncharacterized protein n=1 Tax=Morchella importuna TaxID=1174673 RepID=UPI001E8EDB58|nr:uncharacterized protein LAJ45_06928 [Morchella importuna]KAH8148953.1 hypothetical protein LAJ45_06928 [Morchella importuna]
MERDTKGHTPKSMTRGHIPEGQSPIFSSPLRMFIEAEIYGSSLSQDHTSERCNQPGGNTKHIIPAQMYCVPGLSEDNHKMATCGSGSMPIRRSNFSNNRSPWHSLRHNCWMVITGFISHDSYFHGALADTTPEVSVSEPELGYRQVGLGRRPREKTSEDP